MVDMLVMIRDNSYKFKLSAFVKLTLKIKFDKLEKNLILLVAIKSILPISGYFEIKVRHFNIIKPGFQKR
jgi:hypothetical protein